MALFLYPFLLPLPGQEMGTDIMYLVQKPSLLRCFQSQVMLIFNYKWNKRHNGKDAPGGSATALFHSRSGPVLPGLLLSEGHKSTKYLCQGISLTQCFQTLWHYSLHRMQYSFLSISVSMMNLLLII
jgi:hypothetical protein